MFDKEIKQFIETRIDSQTPFAVFRMPGQTEVRTDGEEGIVVLVNEFCRPYKGASRVNEREDVIKSGFMPSWDKAGYIKAVERVIARHREMKGGKTVVSRVISGETCVNSIIEATERYFDNNPYAFCALILIDGYLWIIATPELLLSIRDGQLKTMALAGTRPAGTEDEEWDSKNLAEQKIVADYILSKLTELGIKDISQKTKTKRSGNVEHICTDFVADANDFIDRTPNYLEVLLDTLSPTPAVCGFPLNEAKENISQLEPHNRVLYAGYTVVQTGNGDVDVFVNLRCARIDPEAGKFTIFTGSGITSDSSAENEWKETELKAAPLLQLLDLKGGEDEK